LAKPYYEKGRAYDIPHVEWMMKQADHIADIEHLDKKLLLPIVILHDVGYGAVPSGTALYKGKESKRIHMEEGAKISQELLQKVHYSEEYIDTIVRYISVHDNWFFNDDTPYKECKEMGVFNDLEFLYDKSDYGVFADMAEKLGKDVSTFLKESKVDEKLSKRPFCCDTTKELFNEYISRLESEVK
jgi:hypothetical protein